MSTSAGMKAAIEDLTRAAAEHMERALTNSETASALVQTAHIEMKLANLICERQPHLRRQMNDRRTLGSFASKIDKAESMGIIDAALRSDLDYVRKIRNEFAHSATLRTFDADPVKDKLADLNRSLGATGKGIEIWMANVRSLVGRLDSCSRAP